MVQSTNSAVINSAVNDSSFNNDMAAQVCVNYFVFANSVPIHDVYIALYSPTHDHRRQAMRHFVSLLFLAGVLLLLSACTNVKYANDFKSGTDFSHLKTYSWRAVMVDIAGVDKNRLQQFANEQLGAQGFTPVTTGADMLIDLQVFARVSQGGNTNLGIGIGLPVGRHGSIGLGTGQTLGRGKQEGVIVIDITQAKDNLLVWRGNAEGIPLINFSLNAEHKLRESFTKILQAFPPASVTK